MGIFEGVPFLIAGVIGMERRWLYLARRAGLLSAAFSLAAARKGSL